MANPTSIRNPLPWKKAALILFILGCTMLLFFRAKMHIEEAHILNTARLYSASINSFRTLYTSEVVSAAKQSGLTISHQYHQMENAIPLPATLSIRLGEVIGQRLNGSNAYLYSAYPFPWRQSEGLKDDFRKTAWNNLTENPNQEYYAFVELNNRRTLRFATADILDASCVNCHNSHPDTPFSKWQAGDVRGILEVQIPLSQILLEANDNFDLMLLLFLSLVILSIVIFWLDQTKLNNKNTELSLQIDKTKQAMSLVELEADKRLALEREQLALKETALHNEKMESLGRMSSGIAHDMNNLFTPILGYAQVLEKELPNDAASAKEDLKRIIDCSKRGKKLIGQVLTFGKTGHEHFVNIDVRKMMENVLLDIRQMYNDDVNFRFSQTAEKLFIYADEAKIQQVLSNLLVNAAQAAKSSAKNAEVELELRVETKGQGDDRVRFVAIKIKDNGPGIPQQIQQKIFAPFFSTKKKTEGYGMGLFMVKTTVEELQGSIKLQQSDGSGSTFVVTIPEVTSLIKDKKLQQPLDVTENARILLVDDMPDILRVVKRLLETVGYQVKDTSSAKQAVALFAANPESFDLVLTDYSMPEMDGTETCRQIHQINPDIAVILMTGFAEHINSNNCRDYGFADLLNKPLNLDDVVTTIEQALGK